MIDCKASPIKNCLEQHGHQWEEALSFCKKKSAFSFWQPASTTVFEIKSYAKIS